jgi:DNA invertase Pin-like site-specific DNA recombinase
VDTASGALDERPELAKILDQLRPADILVVWKLDRLGRSLRHLIDTIAELQRRDVGFRSLQESIDTTTPGGKLIFHLFGALAEFERDLIRQRTLAGLAAARARGRAGGRPPSMTPTKIATLSCIAVAQASARRAVRGELGLELVPLRQAVDPGADNRLVVMPMAAPDRLRDGAHRPHHLVGLAATHQT